MNQYKVLSSHSGMYTIYDERNKQSLSDTDVCNLLNDFKRELMIKEDLIQQLRNTLYTDDRKKYLEYRGKFIRVCEELAEMNMDYKKLSDENEQLNFELKECREHKLFSRRQLEEENEQLKQFPIKLDNRIQKLKEDLEKLTEIDKSDLNPQAVEDVAIVIGMSLNALKEFKKELKGDVE